MAEGIFHRAEFRFGGVGLRLGGAELRPDKAERNSGTAALCFGVAEFRRDGAEARFVVAALLHTCLPMTDHAAGCHQQLEISP